MLGPHDTDPLNLHRTGERVQEAVGQLDLNARRWSSSSKKALVVLVLLLPVLLAGASFRGHPSYALTAFGDLTQFFLLATTTLFFAWKGLSTRGTLRAFWLLFALGFGMWSVNMFLWVYYEVWFNRPVPSVPNGEFLLFTKLVPMLAALALEPNNDKPDRSRLLGLFDLTSLLVYWTYVYLFWAMAYLLAGNDLASYNSHSDIIDALGNLVFLLALAVAAFRSRGTWRGFYLHFLGAAATYGLASVAINWAIESGRYYTGSVYDVPLTSAMAWFCFTSITFTADSPSGQQRSSEELNTQGGPTSRTALWPARLSMLATLSTPAIGLWLVMGGETQNPVRHFRVLLTLFTMLFLTILLLLKQDLLNSNLASYLRNASLAYSNLMRFEDQLVQNEKLASLGKLVARVAQEINRAMLAVGKDVEVLSSHPAADKNRQNMVAKIGEAARRTNSLVESMLSFAQEMPVNRSNVNVRSLLEGAVNLTRAERWHRVRVEIQEDGGASLVEGDANQLIQVFVQIIENAIDAMEGSEAGLLTIAIRTEQERIEIRFADTGLGLKDPRRVFEPFYTTKPVGRGVGLGLSTCYGIIRRHGGEIDCHNRSDGGAVFRLVIPVAVVHTVEAAF
ncbi:MAG: sensor histidine kinase [Candidatus Acidiferrales bacterium]